MTRAEPAGVLSETTPAELGRQIRELRKIKGLTLQAMADGVGVSIGYLSQIERDRSQLPIGTLIRIANMLGVNVSWFFQDQVDAPAEERDRIVRASARRKMSFTGLGITEELLSPNLAGPLEMLLSTIEPGADSGDYSHQGSEAGLLLSGQLTLWIDGRRFDLEAGDSFSFPSTEQHRCMNPGKEPAKVVWVVTPPYY